MNPKFIPTTVIDSFVSEFYALKLIEKPKLIYSLKNSTWHIKSDKGNFYLKVFGNDSVEEVEDEVCLCDELNSHTIHTPLIIENKKGNKVAVLNYNGNAFSVILMKEEKLKHLLASTVTKDEITTIITTVAKMHKLLIDGQYSKSFKEKSVNKNKQITFSFYEDFIISTNAKYISAEKRLG